MIFVIILITLDCFATLATDAKSSAIKLARIAETRRRKAQPMTGRNEMQKSTNNASLRGGTTKQSRSKGVALVFLFCSSAVFAEDFRFQTGDLLFQVGKSTELNEAIAEVTFGENDIRYTHVGVVSVENDTVFVIEATPPEVCKTVLDTFLLRSAQWNGQPLVTVGRLKPEYRETIPQAIANAETLLGKPYDYIYSPDNDAYYCSELVTLSFLNQQNEPLFETVSMTFRDADGNMPAYWLEHFEKHHAEIPENRPGSNPGNLSKSDKIEIVYRYF